MSRRATFLTAVTIFVVLVAAGAVLTYGSWWAGAHQACTGLFDREMCSSILPIPAGR